MRLGLLLRVNPWSVALVTAGVGLAVAPLFANAVAGHRGPDRDAQAEIENLRAERDHYRSMVDRSVHAADRASESAHSMEARLSQALATNRDSVAYAQQLEAELRLRAGWGPDLARSSAPTPEELADLSVDAVASSDAWSASSPAPELPNATPATVTVTQFIEADQVEARKIRARLARKSWDEVVQRAVIGECKGKAGAGRFDGCAAEVEGRLAPFQIKAQQCMAGNFGGIFYFDAGNRFSPPSNGVSLDRGVVVFCDPNLRDGGLSDDEG